LLGHHLHASQKRMVLGQCEKVMFNQGGWKKARQEQQMRTGLVVYLFISSL
jgi:hypothetical protein